MPLTLSEMNIGKKGKIAGFAKVDRSYRTRLMSMGVIRGTEFKITRVAPLGNPIEIEIKGYSLSLRKDEANIVLVEEI